MSAVQKTNYLPDAATRDLWRVAEAGDLSGLASVLPRVRDINARNEHGVTALMRAAQYGHAKMVRALLDQGADANIKRNDKFTALALAAFFGHTEIVRALMEHGADSEAATRYDTSPHMWATARTFNEVVNQLEKPASVEKPAPVKAQQPVAAPVMVSTDPDVRAVGKSAVVRTLKDPPEIWDLVHEAPRGFDARSAFLTRLKASGTGLAFRLATVAVLIGAGVIGVMVLHRAQARNERNVTSARQESNAPPQAVIPSPVSAPAVSTADSTVATPSSVEPEVNNASVSEVPIVNREPTWHSSRRASHRFEQNSTPKVAASEVVQAVPTPTAKTLPPETKPKASAPLSSQMITPVKAATPKGKVIQWP